VVESEEGAEDGGGAAGSPQMASRRKNSRREALPRPRLPPQQLGVPAGTDSSGVPMTSDVLVAITDGSVENFLAEVADE